MYLFKILFSIFLFLSVSVLANTKIIVIKEIDDSVNTKILQTIDDNLNMLVADGSGIDGILFSAIQRKYPEFKNNRKLTPAVYEKLDNYLGVYWYLRISAIENGGIDFLKLSLYNSHKHSYVFEKSLTFQSAKQFTQPIQSFFKDVKLRISPVNSAKVNKNLFLEKKKYLNPSHYNRTVLAALTDSCLALAGFIFLTMSTDDTSSIIFHSVTGGLVFIGGMFSLYTYISYRYYTPVIANLQFSPSNKYANINLSTRF